MKKKSKKKKKSRLILAFLLIALFFLGALLVISFSAWELLENKGIEKIEIVDGCSLFMGSILHQIRDLPDCENSCRSECYIINKDFYEAEFEASEGGCNSCDCYCK